MFRIIFVQYYGYVTSGVFVMLSVYLLHILHYNYNLIKRLKVGCLIIGWLRGPLVLTLLYTTPVLKVKERKVKVTCWDQQFEIFKLFFFKENELEFQRLQSLLNDCNTKKMTFKNESLLKDNSTAEIWRRLGILASGWETGTNSR